MSATERKEAKILLVDDHPFIHEGLNSALSSYEDLVVCGEADSTKDALEKVSRLKPDLVVSDISLRGKSGLELVADMKHYFPDIPVVILSMHDEKIYGVRALKAGARGYVMKKDKVTKLVEALRKVLAGHVFVSEELSDFLFSDLTQAKRTEKNQSGMNRLTAREFEVFHLVGSGKKPEKIAADLSISLKTVNSHRSNIREKLGFESFSDLLIYAVRWMSSEG